jgi:hypothetical protein
VRIAIYPAPRCKIVSHCFSASLPCVVCGCSLFRWIPSRDQPKSQCARAQFIRIDVISCARAFASRSKSGLNKKEIWIKRQAVDTCNSFRRASIGLDACLTGKSLLGRFRGVSSPFEKIFCFSEVANHLYIPAVQSHSEGRCATSSTRGLDAVDADGAPDEGA